jgi:8-oxo-dGTP pyrophosphatase MutT (NUDIX family)
LSARLWNALGRVLYWVSRPGIWLIIAISPPRTRVVVKRNRQILLVRDWLGNGCWKLPGGGLHRGENPAVGAARELQEEVGISLAPSELIKLGRFNLRSSGAQERLIAYRAEVKPAVRAQVKGLEIVAGQWVYLDEATNLPLTEATRVILAAFSERQSLLH